MKLNRRKFCECGCGQRVKKRFIKGHMNRNKVMPLAQRKLISDNLIKRNRNPCQNKIKRRLPLCACGCGNRVLSSKNIFIFEHINRHRVPSIEARNKMSKTHLLEWATNPKMKKELSKRMKGDNNPAKRPEVRIKISKKLTGRKLSEETKEKLSKVLTGFKHSDEAKLNMKMSQINNWKSEVRRERGRLAIVKNWENAEYRKNQIEKNSGENHWNWQGGITCNSYPEDWTNALKESIRIRDDYRCKVCCTKEKDLKTKLDVHHIDYNKENCNPDNLISLCHTCHMRTNYDREKWVSFFQGSKRIRKLLGVA